MALRESRLTKVLTQEELAEKADVAPKMISFIERNLRNPSINLMDSLAQGLEMPLSDLIRIAEAIREKQRR